MSGKRRRRVQSSPMHALRRSARLVMKSLAMNGTKTIQVPLASPPTPSQLQAGVEVLLGGGVVALPTDTIYGIASCLHQVHRLYQIKGRNAEKPIAVAVPNIASISAIADTSSLPPNLISHLLPGPRTLVLRRLPSLCAALNPETDLVGLRIPDAPLINALTAALGQPLALTSANTSGQPSSLHVREFRALWPQLDLLYDGGALESGRAGSTVVDLSQAPEYRILRQGSAFEETSNILATHGFRPASSPDAL